MSTKENTFRAFIAIDLPDETKLIVEKIIKLLKKQQQFGEVHFTQTNDLHLTIRFLGNIKESENQELITRVAAKLSLTKAFTLNFQQLIIFPSQENPVALALKPEPIIELIKINKLIEEGINGLDVKDETKSFAPHLTLAKVRNIKKITLPEIEVPKIVFEVKYLTLFRSELKQNGSVYSPLACFPLCAII